MTSYFDALTMACVADELRATALGGRVQAALLPGPLAVELEIYAGHRRWYLLASAHPEMCRIVVTSQRLRRGAEKETALLVLMRKYLRGAILSAIEQPPFERILRLGFDHAQWGSTELVVEVMGRHSNVILLGAGAQVLDALKRVGPAVSPARPVLPGQAYRPPPSQEKLPPTDLSESSLEQMLGAAEEGTPLWQVLVAGLQGVSPLLAKEIVYRAVGDVRARVTPPAPPQAGGDGGAPPQAGGDGGAPPQAGGENKRPLVGGTGMVQVAREMFAPLGSHQWQPTVVTEDGVPAIYAPYKVTHRAETTAVESMSQAIETVLAAAGSLDPYAAIRRSVRDQIGAARERLEARRQSLERSAAEAGEAEQWRKWGEWTLALAHTVEQHQTELLADTGEGEVLRIPLDPDLSAAENAQAFFARYRKAQRARQGEPQRLREVQLALQDLEQLDTDLQLAATRPEIDAVRATLAESGYLRGVRAGSATGPGLSPSPTPVQAVGEKKRPKAGAPPLPLRKQGHPPFPPRKQGGRQPAPPLQFAGPDGAMILVGRNSRQNDDITFRRARPGDWWFHARGVPGAHVIVRAEGESPSEQTIQLAAGLAAYFSKRRSERNVEVDYTQRRHVRRIPGAPPGLVTYRQERTVLAVPINPAER